MGVQGVSAQETDWTGMLGCALQLLYQVVNWPCPASQHSLSFQAVVFRVDYVVEVAGNKEFGSVFLQQGTQQENVALSIVQNGWAKVRSTRQALRCQSAAAALSGLQAHCLG